MLPEIQEAIAALDWMAPFPAGAVTALLPASVIHRRGPAGEIATVLAIPGWFLSPIWGVTGLTVGLIVATWFSGKRCGRDWRTAVMGAMPPTAAVWVAAWAAPERWGEVSTLLASWAGALAAYVVIAMLLAVLFRAVEGHLRPTLDPKRFFDKQQRELIIRRGGNRCAYCGADGSALGVTLEADHVVPHSMGGRTCAKSNGQPLCGGCNRIKADRTDKEARAIFAQRMGFPAGSNGPRRWLAVNFRAAR